MLPQSSSISSLVGLCPLTLFLLGDSLLSHFFNPTRHVLICKHSAIKFKYHVLKYSIFCTSFWLKFVNFWTWLVGILEKGEWITGGLWGAYEQWADAAATASGEKKEAWKPHKEVIDEISAEHPVFINNYNRQLYLANSLALKAAGLENLARS